MITGSLTKHRRLANSTKEDVVVNGLVLNNAQLQRGIINVNIHVPNISIPLSGGGFDNSQPNSVRINNLTNAVIPLLKDQWGSDYNFDIEQITLITEDKSSFNNIRIEFQSINI